jgi:hypothetical protein
MDKSLVPITDHIMRTAILTWAGCAGGTSVYVKNRAKFPPEIRGEKDGDGYYVVVGKEWYIKLFRVINEIQ